MTQTIAEKYDEHYQKDLKDLSLNLSGAPLNSPNALLMRIVYEQKTMEIQDKYNKQQIELQHKRNTELVKEQVKWVKYSAILTAISTLTAAIAGACLTYMLTRPSPQQTTKTETQQETAQSTKNTTSGTRPEQKLDKVPSSSPPPK